MGFLGFGNYAKPGKGVKKETIGKKRIFIFFELYSRKFTKLIQLNLLYVMFCIPSIMVALGAYYLSGTLFENSQWLSMLATVIGIIAFGFTGPATAGLIKIAKSFTEEKPVFLLSDFFQALKENFKPAVLVGLINSILTYIILKAFNFYYIKTLVLSMWFCVPLGLVIFVAVIAIMSNFYIYLTMVSVNINIKGLIKNSVSFVFLGTKTNLITLFLVLLIFIPCIMYFWIMIPLILLLIFSTGAMIVAFNSFQYIYKYCIKPYYAMNGLQDPYEEIGESKDSIFEDTTL